MPRLFHREEWFYEISPTALAESEFEEILVQNSHLLRKEAFVVPFKKTVYAPDGRSARADLAIIDGDYRRWTVVEVEMLRHDLYRHVIPQVRIFRDATYGQEHAAYLAAQNSTLHAEKLNDMLRGQPPDILVLVNKYDQDWADELRRYSVILMTFEIFRSVSNRSVYAIDGELPETSVAVLTELKFSQLSRLLLVQSPAALTFAVGEKIPISIDDQITFWERFDTATECYLSPLGQMPIEPGRRYGLIRLDNGQHAISELG
jgi:hypothetical protein